jgi:hypothetical protein
MGASGRYRVQLSDAGWQRVEAPGVDLALRKGSDAVIAIRVLDKGASAYETVLGRKGQLVESGVTVATVYERLAFLEESDLVPVAVARYRVTEQEGSFDYIAAAVELDDAILETYGYSAGSQAGLKSEVDRIVGSLRIANAPASAGEADPR